MSLVIDVDNDGVIDPGDTVTLNTTVTNSSLPADGSVAATGVQVFEDLTGMTPVANTLNVSPLAFDDTYNAVGNVPLAVSAADGVLNASTAVHVTAGADVEFAGDTFGTGAGQTHVVAGTDSNAAGSVTFAIDGSFIFTPATDFIGAATSTTRCATPASTTWLATPTTSPALAR